MKNLYQKFYQRFLNELDIPEIVSDPIKVNIEGNELVLIACINRRLISLSDLKHIEYILNNNIPEYLREYLTLSVELFSDYHMREFPCITITIKLKCNKQTLKDLVTILEIENGQKNTFNAENL